MFSQSPKRVKQAHSVSLKRMGLKENAKVIGKSGSRGRKRCKSERNERKPKETKGKEQLHSNELYMPERTTRKKGSIVHAFSYVSESQKTERG